jgi:hypothetical protein
LISLTLAHRSSPVAMLIMNPSTVDKPDPESCHASHRAIKGTRLAWAGVRMRRIPSPIVRTRPARPRISLSRPMARLDIPCIGRGIEASLFVPTTSS